MTVLSISTHICAHRLCRCPTCATSRYCSPYCANVQAADEEHGACACSHADCEERPGASMPRTDAQPDAVVTAVGPEASTPPEVPPDAPPEIPPRPPHERPKEPIEEPEDPRPPIRPPRPDELPIREPPERERPPKRVWAHA